MADDGDDDDFDICSKKHGGNKKSKEAFKKSKKGFRTACHRIHAYAAEMHFKGVTGNELYFDLFGGSSDPNKSKCSISGPGARLSEMSMGKYGPDLLMVPINKERPTRSGRMAQVYVTSFVYYLMVIAEDPAVSVVKKEKDEK